MSALASLTMAIVFARFLPQETYGTYKYVMSIVGLIGAFSFSGMTTVVARAVAQGHDKTILGVFNALSLRGIGSDVWFGGPGAGQIIYSMGMACSSIPC